MKKTKMLVAMLLAGIILQQAVSAQPSAGYDASNHFTSVTVSNNVYDFMLSNVSKLSTGSDETVTPAASPSSVTVISNATTTSSIISNKPSSVTIISNTATTSSIVSNKPSSITVISNATTTTSSTVSNESTSVTVVSNATMTSSTISNSPAQTSGSSNSPVMTTSNEPPSGTVSNETVAATNPPATAIETNAPPAVEAAVTNAPEAAPAAVVLPIQFQDVPITTAIEALARQAGINYQLDPKIGYGQPDAQGHVTPEPTLSIRWENVTAREALLALLDNNGLQLVEDPKIKIAKITTKDPSAPPPLVTRVIQLKYSSTADMQAAIVSVLTDKRSKVVPDTRTSQLVIVATEKEQADVDTLVNQLDTATRQVLIETKLVEVSSNPSTTKGIDWSGTLQGQHFSFGNGTLSGTTTFNSPGTPVTTTSPFGITTTTTPQSSQSTALTINEGNGGVSLSTASGFLPGTGFLNADGVNAVLSFFNQSADAQVISTPRVVTLDNTTAHIEVTQNIPIINISAGTQTTAGGSSITYSNLGTILDVTPRISANDYVWMKVVPQVSSILSSQTVSLGGGAAVPVDTFQNRSIDTQVLIPNANTLVMGGMVQDNPTATYTKVPVLGDIPVLGWALFSSSSKQIFKDNLLIFITPTILKDADFQPATTRFLKSKPAVLKPVMNPHSFWDSAKPGGDWSNPLPPADDISVPSDTSNPLH